MGLAGIIINTSPLVELAFFFSFWPLSPIYMSTRLIFISVFIHFFRYGSFFKKKEKILPFLSFLMGRNPKFSNHGTFSYNVFWLFCVPFPNPNFLKKRITPRSSKFVLFSLHFFSSVAHLLLSDLVSNI